MVQRLKEEDYRCHSALDEHKDHQTWHQLNISLFLFVLSTSISSFVPPLLSSFFCFAQLESNFFPPFYNQLFFCSSLFLEGCAVNARHFWGIPRDENCLLMPKKGPLFWAKKSQVSFLEDLWDLANKSSTTSLWSFELYSTTKEERTGTLKGDWPHIMQSLLASKPESTKESSLGEELTAI